MYYLIVAFFLFVCSLLSVVDKENKIRYLCSCVLIFSFCTFRYGVGYDYFSYELIFDLVPNDVFSKDYDGIHGEYLFLKIFSFFKSIGVSYEVVNALIIGVINVLMIRFISKYSYSKNYSLLLLFLLYFTYIFSTLRQGLALSLFCTLCIPSIINKKYVKYYVFLTFIFFIHSSTIVLAVLPITLSLFKFIERKYFLFLFISLCIGLGSIPLIKFLFPFMELEFSYVGFFVRILMFFFIYSYRDLLQKDTVMLVFYRIYCIGFLIYICLIASDLLSSRIFMYFKILDIIMIPYIIYVGRNRIRDFLLVSTVSFVVFVNFISGIADFYGLNFMEYPYINIFQKEQYFKELGRKYYTDGN